MTSWRLSINLLTIMALFQLITLTKNDQTLPKTPAIQKDSKIAELKIFNGENLIQSTPIYALSKTQKVNFLYSLFTSINYLIWGDV